MPREQLLIDCEHDITPRSGSAGGRPRRIRSHQVFLELEDGQGMIISDARLAPFSGQAPVMHKCLGYYDLDD
jgi:hypothetical protein